MENKYTIQNNKVFQEVEAKPALEALTKRKAELEDAIRKAQFIITARTEELNDVNAQINALTPIAVTQEQAITEAEETFERVKTAEELANEQANMPKVEEPILEAPIEITPEPPIVEDSEVLPEVK